eukprot:scaffold115_cov304-Prasinococcus_capsulatus_cf.AAC.3
MVVSLVSGAPRRVTEDRRAVLVVVTYQASQSDSVKHFVHAVDSGLKVGWVARDGVLGVSREAPILETLVEAGTWGGVSLACRRPVLVLCTRRLCKELASSVDPPPQQVLGLSG